MGLKKNYLTHLLLTIKILSSWIISALLKTFQHRPQIVLGIITAMGLFLIVTTCFFLFSGKTEGREHTDCYANDPNPYLKFSSKTAYEFVYERPRLRDPGVPGCEPVQIWLLTRHGTRFPGKKTIADLQKLSGLRNEIIRNHDEFKRGRLCYADIDSLKAWKFNVSLTDDSLLTQQGFWDMQFMARRLRTKFPNLFKQEYSPNLYRFRHTDSERTRQSAQAFAEGMFGKGQSIWIPPGIKNDPIIKPYENCTYWIDQVDKNPETERESKLFELSSDMTALVHNVSLRLGFLYDLPLETIDKIYDMCRYEKAWRVNERSPWCAAFVKHELLALEYHEDLKYYYNAGYGNKLNLRLGCTTIKDMLEHFEKLEDENSQNSQEPLAVFHFSHERMVVMTLSRMGIPNYGIPLRHDNYYQQSQREWMTSDLSPFAANLAAVFYKCSSGEYNRVMFFVNEKRVDYEGCDVGLCSWSYIRNKFSDIQHTCDLDWCYNRSSPLNYSPYLLVVLFVHFISRKLPYLQ